MRKQQIKQVVEKLKLMEETHNSGRFTEAQQNARELVGFLESNNCDNKKIIELLTQYDELLKKAAAGEVGVKLLRKHFTKILNTANHELKPSRMEITFISHIASMSDCLESIYLTAKDDPACDAHWIPVPYYEHDADGNPKNLKYEGTEFYDEKIEIIDWKEYDIEARKPDAIFTFNTYDRANKITSIHPDYYNSRLCNLTDMLVYVPYYALEEATHVVGIANEILAHKIILPTERRKNYYRQHFKDTMGRKFGSVDHKLVALGSPKRDKIVNTKKENCDLLQEWAYLIQDKKVILYASSIAPALQSGPIYLSKLKQVLDTFAKREDVVLWWRPHPLLMQTYVSMVPQLLPAYKRLVDDYRKNTCGIYDDTPNLHRAIAMGDGYCGDRGSLLYMYQMTGKPAMMLDTVSDELFKNCSIGYCWQEKDGKKIQDFIDYVLSNPELEQAEGEAINADGTAGQKIYEHIREIILK